MKTCLEIRVEQTETAHWIELLNRVDEVIAAEGGRGLV